MPVKTTYTLSMVIVVMLIGSCTVTTLHKNALIASMVADGASPLHARCAFRQTRPCDMLSKTTNKKDE